jgi:uncharacterized protein (DUF849 family)
MIKHTFVQAALNGNRAHPAVPRTPAELATDTRLAVKAGASSVHIHPYNDHGRETLDPKHCAAALLAVRAVCPGIPISLSTSAAIEPDPKRRLALVASWDILPNLVTANQGEEGIVELVEVLLSKSIGIEAGLLGLEDARQFIKNGIASHCVRVMVEPLDEAPHDAVLHAEAMENLLAEHRIGLEQVHHGEGIALWSVDRRAIRRGHGIRTGLEDTSVMPDGSLASGNEQLVLAAMSLFTEQGVLPP